MRGSKANEAYITFFSPRAGIPPKTAANHYRFPLTKISLYHRMVSLLKVVEYELADRRVVVHFGWPLSSWWDRLAVGVMVFNLMRLPRLFPQFEFDIKYFRRPKESPAASRRRGRAVTGRPGRLLPCPGRRLEVGGRCTETFTWEIIPEN